VEYYVSELNRYPVKSMGRESLGRATVDRFGIEMDRRWMLIDDKHKFITQRTVAKMAQFSVTHCQRSEGGWSVTIESNNQQLFVNSAQHFTNGSISARVWGDLCEGLVADGEINQWLSQALGVSCQLVFMDDGYQRKVDSEYADNNETVSFADGFPLLLTTGPSLAAFNQYLKKPINMVRFRPNIVVDGNDAFAEDSWKRIRVGNLDFKVAKPCARCAIPTINPNTLKKEREVFNALTQYCSRDGEVYFGQNLIALGEGEVAVGDIVEILE